MLALIQGITEFLPISSAAHLILVDPAMLGLGLPVPDHSPADKLVLDVAVHVGTLVAVTIYFARDLARMLGGAGDLVRGRMTAGGRLGLLVVLATLPVVLVGGLFKEVITDSLRTVEIIAWTTVIFAVALHVADRYPRMFRRLADMRWGHAAAIGAAQVLALVPGVSRSGITMTAARALGFERTDAARFSLLLSIPTIAGAGLLAALDLHESGNMALGRDAAVAAILACLSALAAIALLMRWLARSDFAPFVVYRLVLGAGLLVWVYA